MKKTLAAPEHLGTVAKSDVVVVRVLNWDVWCIRNDGGWSGTPRCSKPMRRIGVAKDNFVRASLDAEIAARRMIHSIQY
jgi:hypothetical protein